VLVMSLMCTVVRALDDQASSGPAVWFAKTSSYLKNSWTRPSCLLLGMTDSRSVRSFEARDEVGTGG
jgi:hypothetical protein